MPAQPQWLLRIPRIVEELAALDTPVVDRASIERLFGVRRRRAIHLLGAFGGYQAGRTFLVDREALLEQLRAVAAGERFDFEKRRRERLAAKLERVRKHLEAARVTIAPSSPLPGETAGLPPGVRLEPGCLTIEFNGVEELLARLYGIAQAAAEDFARFQSAAGEDK